MRIVIGGDPGSGKSTVSKMLAERLKFKRYSAGDLRGKMALDRKITIDELNKLGEKESFTDKDVDEYQRKLGETENNFVIDGRLSFYFIPDSFKVYLKVDERTAAERVYKAPRRPDEKKYTSIEDVLETLHNRVESDKRRYQKYYEIDYTNQKQYDLVIDTTHATPETVADKILAELKKKKLMN